MIIEKGKRMLLVRYSDFLHSDCIDEHIEVIQENGYCWFGKIGRQKPSRKFCDIVLQDESPMLLLRSAKKTYLCGVEEIVYEKPSDGVYPSYYAETLFAKGNEPSIYFKLTSCQQIDRSILYSFIVVSSKNPLPYSLQKSMNSFFFIECDQDVEIKGVI